MTTRFMTKNKRRIPITDRSASLKLRVPALPSSGTVKKTVKVSKAFAGDNDFWLVQEVHTAGKDVIAVPESQIVKGKDKAEALKRLYEKHLG
ncbi:hypothetical protein GQ472_01770 [archaeon]|nr:hypothetical protein [archaeon]